MKINFKDFVKQVSKKSGYAQWNIAEVFDVGAEVVKENLEKGLETSVFRGMIIYPSVMKQPTGEIVFARARFGKFFKDLNSSAIL